MYVKTFKGYEDKTADLDQAVNDWVQAHRDVVEVKDIKAVLSHEYESRARTGDLLYTVVYNTKSGVPVAD